MGYDLGHAYWSRPISKGKFAEQGGRGWGRQCASSKPWTQTSALLYRVVSYRTAPHTREVDASRGLRSIRERRVTYILSSDDCRISRFVPWNAMLPFPCFSILVLLGQRGCGKNQSLGWAPSSGSTERLKVQTFTLFKRQRERERKEKERRR